MIEEVEDDVIIIGTAHVSAKSVQEVADTIRERRPKQVLIELDAARLKAIQDPERWKNTDIVQVIKDKKQHLFLIQLYLANMQARVGRETGVSPGSEMLEAIKVAEEVGAEVVLIDRDVGITLKRGFGSMRFSQRISLGMNFLMEMLPSAAKEERPPAKKTAIQGFGVLAALLAIMSLIPSLRGRIVGGASNILDVLIGFPAVPAVTMLLLGLLGGGLIAAAAPRKERPDDIWGLVEHVPYPAMFLGLLGAWGWGFTQGMSPSFIAGLPGMVLAPVVAAILVGGGLLIGGRVVLGLRRFSERREAVVQGDDFDVDALLEQDAITAMTEEFAQFAPSVKEALIDERDAYMASHVAERAKNGSLVAVVGAGHVPGMQRHLATGTDGIDRDALDALPSKRMTLGKFIAFAIPVAIIAAFAYAAYSGGVASLWENLRIWILINGTLSAIGAAIALGHPISWIVAFLAAPITSLNPLLAAGWFAGLAEAKLRTPTVKDFEAIHGLETMKEFWTNPVVRVLLVTALANLGSAVGTWIAGFQIAQNLVGA